MRYNADRLFLWVYVKVHVCTDKLTSIDALEDNGTWGDPQNENKAYVEFRGYVRFDLEFLSQRLGENNLFVGDLKVWIQNSGFIRFYQTEAP